MQPLSNHFSHEMNCLSDQLTQTAANHLRDILLHAIVHDPAQTAVVIYDTQCPLAVTLTKAYQHVLPAARYVHFETVTNEDVFALFDTLAPGDLVVLIQSTSFRMKDFRIRVELFEKFIKVIEHPYLARMPGQQSVYYIDSLAYDPAYYRGVGHALKGRIDSASQAVVDSDGEQLRFNGPLEPAKLNIGDYTHMKNIGGQFPIGEVFTEAKTLESVSGRVRIYAFADSGFNVSFPEQPITLVIHEGRVTQVIDSTPALDEVLAKIRADEGEVWLRELGFGMNRAFSRERVVSDIGTYERLCGIHLSLGAKHGVYKKPNFKRGKMWHHIDVFAITHAVYLDETRVFQDGAWRV